MKNCAYRFLTGFFTVLFVFQLTACGTLLYPERRGQKTGRIDAGVAILDGIGLLFFIIPGVVAFAVDFATGAIFLPSGQGSTKVFGANELPAIHVDSNDLNQEKIEAVLFEQTGQSIDLNHPDLVVLKLKDHQDLLEKHAKWRAWDQGVTSERLASLVVSRN